MLSILTLSIFIFLYILHTSAETCDTNILNDYFGTPNLETGQIIKAAKDNKPNIIKCLLANGADLNELDPATGQTAFSIAAQKGYFDIVNFMWNDEPYYNQLDDSLQDNGGKTALIWSVLGGYDDISNMICNTPEALNLQTITNDSALIIAAKLNRISFTTTVITIMNRNNTRSGFCNLDLVNSAGETALIRASRLSQPDIAILLINQNALLNIQTKAYRQTALMVAAKAGNLEIVRSLINKGADLNLRGAGGHSALDIANTAGYSDIVLILANNGAKYKLRGVNIKSF